MQERCASTLLNTKTRPLYNAVFCMASITCGRCFSEQHWIIRLIFVQCTAHQTKDNVPLGFPEALSELLPNWETAMTEASNYDSGR